MEVVIGWEGKHRGKNAYGFAFEVREPGGSKVLQIWIADHIRESIEQRFDDDWSVMQVALAKAKQYLKSSNAFRDRPDLDNVDVDGDADPLEGDLVSAVDLHCHHLLGRDRQARCQIDHHGFSDLPVRCVPGKNACWRQVCATE